MAIEKLQRSDLRLIVACAVTGAASLYVGIRYFFRAFPEASIEFRTTKGESQEIAESFLGGLGLEIEDRRHAAVFGYDEDAKTFLEREVGVEESALLLGSTIRLWRWQHRWLRPLEAEEYAVEVTTTGEPVALHHRLPEDAAGPSLEVAEGRRLAETFLVETMGRRLEELEFIESSAAKRPNRLDHDFTWKLAGFSVKEAEYWIEVGVAGDRVTSYDEHLKVPDAWLRSYSELRSWNLAAGQVDLVFLMLTAVAMLVVLVLRVRKADVRLGVSALVGGITVVLVTVSQLNMFPTELFSYDTTSSYGGFLLGQLLTSVSAGLLLGAIVFLLTAASEPLYRERFRAALSLTSLFRVRALWTRESFRSILVGLTLTCFFFAFENVFYIIAHAFGAWSPRDVPYSELLSTAVPWVFVLFFGWFPAISEEFISRIFSILFLERVLRSRVAAILISAAIWGFGHAAYPNQPYWIRGLEVGIAGIVFGLVFLRFGILSVLVTHFSVDALYTALVLVRSDSPYHVITGALSAGIFVVLFAVMALRYVLKGGFLQAEHTNEAEDRLLEGERETARAAAAAGAVLAPGEAAARGIMAPVAGSEASSEAAIYTPLRRGTIAAGLVLAGGLAALRLVPSERFGDWVDFAVTRPRAVETASSFLRGAGFDVALYEKGATALDRTDAGAAVYLARTGGLERAKTVYRDLVPTPLWRARFYVPGQKQEYRVSIDPTSGAALGFTRELDEDGSGATIEPEEARRIAESFVRERGLDLAAGELKETAATDRKARRDHTLVWEQPIDGGGEARVRHEVIVQGNEVGSWSRGVKVPEEWERDWNRTTATSVTLRWLKVPLLGLLAGLAIVQFVGAIRRGTVPWKLALTAGAIAAVASIVRLVVSSGRPWIDQYDTSIPAPIFRVTLLVAWIVAAVVAFLGALLVAAVAGAIHPSASALLSAAKRRAQAADALAAGIITTGFLLGAPALLRIAASFLPSGQVLDGVPVPADAETSAPWIAVLGGAASTALFLPALGAIALGVVARFVPGAAARTLFFALFVVAMIPQPARFAPQYALGAIEVAILVGLGLALARFFLRRNALAWVFGAWMAAGTSGAIKLISQSAPSYRQNGMLALCLVALSSLPLVVWAFQGRGLAETRSGAGVRRDS